MEKVIHSRAEMEDAAKELRLGVDKEYVIKFAKNEKCYEINKEDFEAFLAGKSDIKFYKEVGYNHEPIPNPYYKEEVDDFDDFGDGEQAPEIVEIVAEESVVEETVAEVAEEVAEAPAQEEVKTCECEGKIAELEKEIEAKIMELALKDEEIQAKDAHIASLNAELNGLVEIKTEIDAIHQDKVRELEEQITHLLEKLAAPIDYTNVPFETLVDEIAYRGYEVELKYIKKQ